MICWWLIEHRRRCAGGLLRSGETDYTGAALVRADLPSKTRVSSVHNSSFVLIALKGDYEGKAKQLVIGDW
jgi:hypothetical protein